MSELMLVGGADMDPEWFGINEEGRAYVVAGAFAKALGYSGTDKATRLLDEDEKGHLMRVTPGGNQRVSVIYEEGVYRLLFRSNLPEARELTKRATSILRQLRETGVVDTRTPKSFAEALELAAAQARQIEDDQRALAAAAPKVAVFDRFMDTNGLYGVAEAAQLLGTGETRMYRYLREKKLFFDRGHFRYNLPKQRGIEAGWFTVKWLDDEKDRGTALVTPKGITYLRRLMAADQTQQELF